MKSPVPLRREALGFLNPRDGRVPAPVRSMLFGLERFHKHGVSLAVAQPIERRQSWRRRTRAPHFFPQLKANLRMLERARSYLDTLDQEGTALNPAAEWLLDNFHLIEAQLPEIHTDLPNNYYAELPKLHQEPLKGLPRVYGIAWAFVAHTDSNFDPQLLAHFLKAYQTVDLLTLGELWALPGTLRVVLMENLGRLAESIAATSAAHEAANWCFEHTASLNLAALRAIHQHTEQRGVSATFLAQMAQRLRAQSPLDAAPWHAWLTTLVPDLDALLAKAQEAQAADNVSVRNAVTALRTIENMDWVSLVEEVSPVLQALRWSPEFLADSELTRNQITHTIERLARRLQRSELEVARRVVELGLADTALPQRGPAHWTIGPGHADLLATLGASPALRARRGAGLWLRWRVTLYAGVLVLGMVLVLRALLPAHTLPSPAGLATLVLMAFAALECTVAVLHRMLAESVQMHRLPRLALDGGLLAEHATVLAIPCMLSSQRTVRALIERLELHYLANPEAHTQFALLSDWVDAPQRDMPQDAALLQAALEGVLQLNARHGAPDQLPRFLLLHRERIWSEGEAAWMGWERKRGKLEQLLEVLVHGKPETVFKDLGAVSRPHEDARYMLVLDADTELPAGALRAMVAIAAHPLNQPRIDAATRRVVEGYGILQPRIAAPFVAPSAVTAYGLMFSAPWGTDAYNGGSSEVYQDVFDEGSFCGKGLFHVRVVHEVLRNRVPADRLLSHDLFEGMWARCAYLSDVLVWEHPTLHPDVAASLMHRWIRGDWQLLAFVRPLIDARVGGLNLWKLADNLRRSLLAPACVGFVWLNLVSGLVAPLTALGLVLAALGLGPLMGALAGLVPSRQHVALRHFLHEGALEVARALAGTLWHTAALLHTATFHLDAILRALWRMAVSHRGRLQWTTSAQAQAAAGTHWRGFVRRHAPTSVLALLWAGAGMALAPEQLAWWLGLGALWAATPLWLWATAQTVHPAQPQALATQDQHYLSDLARDTWSYFDINVTAQDHHLPPDNLQIEPVAALAHRTSPTNIGLYLLAACCAWRMGLISAQQLGQRLDNTLATLQGLPQHRGHLYNWIDTETLQPLAPRYVSTVDSGNLAASLWTVAQACRDIARQDATPDAAAWLARAQAADARVAAMEFGFLFDRKRRLFHIGYREDDATLDPAYYDLLASEARLTSFVAIAKGDVSQRHWAALGRPFLAFKGLPTLRSWSGSMFEYLMPLLLLDEPVGSLLHRVALAAVRAQQAFGAQHHIPWGVSESAYFVQDRSMAFQYAPFGVPVLALRRTPALDRVVAPYATVLAALLDPAAALHNLRRIEGLGGRGVHGFMEALDFTAARAGEGAGPQQVATFMAHHQGMVMAVLCNLLCQAAPRRWFGSAARVVAHAALLHERMPREIVLQEPTALRAVHAESGAVSAVREFDLQQPLALAPTHCLGNGSYSAWLRPNGAGQSHWRGRAVSRARDDALRDAYGTWIMLRCGDAPGFHSLTAAPHPHPAGRYTTRFFHDHVEYMAACDTFESSMFVWVSADDDVEFRRITLHNLSDAPVDFELLSCMEVVLATALADESHPAFSNLFVQAHASDPACAMLERRAHVPGEKGAWVAHFLATCDATPDLVEVRCNRESLLPRNGHIAQIGTGISPWAMQDTRGNTGLDPVASLSVRLQLKARARVCLTLATAVATEQETLMELMDKHRQAVHLTRDQLMTAALARMRQHELRLETAELHAIQDVCSLLVLQRAQRRALPAVELDRRALWRFGVSGERPVVVVRINLETGIGVVRTLLAAQRLWEFSGLPIDLIILNAEPVSYQMPLQQQITAMVHALGASQHAQPERGSFQVLRPNTLSVAEASALHGYARLDLTADGRPLARLLALGPTVRGNTPLKSATAPETLWAAQLARSQFADEGSSFTIAIDAAHATPRPWINVLANPGFGCLVSESGSGHTWAANSRLNQLTPWSNDALLDPPGEHFLLQDEATNTLMGLLPTLDRNGLAGYHVRHTQGMTEFTQERVGLSVSVRIAVHPDESAKCLHVRITNRRSYPRSLRLLACVEWILGASRRDRMTLATDYVHALQCVLARQLEHQGGFGEGTAFLMLADAIPQQWTCDRSEFFTPGGQLAAPGRLGGASGFGLDPCAALDTRTTLAPQGSWECFWVIGYGNSRESALTLARRLRQPGVLAGVVKQSLAQWDARLSAVQVHTPDPLFDAMVNRWWPYQTTACRLWSKAGFYQAGGATGFRDQLQDAMALAWSEPQRLRDQILLHASRQFVQGDVQHWWHAPTGAGIRTRFSDDLLWLPFVLNHYLACTGDTALLETELPFLEGKPIDAGADDAYYVPATTETRATLYEHAARAIDHALRFGDRGLPLMGTGDWNDGMNRVGHQGRGESVWLGWFLQVLLPPWTDLARHRPDAARAQAWAAAQAALANALQTQAWDGHWYRRAYFDNGNPLGSQHNAECSIDLIAQAWSVFASPEGDPRALEAMASADARLVDRQHGLVRLLDPPLQHAIDHAGYIQAYPPGVRENGGQYAHAGVWALMAQARLGHAKEAWDYFCMLSAAHRTPTDAAKSHYRVEPYVMAGDTYSAPPYTGQGGWSWYTGAAAWMLRASLESILGLTLRADALRLTPCLPPHWDHAALELRLRGKHLRIVLNATGATPPGAVVARTGEWVTLAALPTDCTLWVVAPD